MSCWKQIISQRRKEHKENALGTDEEFLSRLETEARRGWAIVLLSPLVARAGLFALLGLACAFAQKPVPAAVDEVLPKEAPAQPVPFNHKLHTSQGMKCLDCHPIRDPGYQAGYPRESACMGCHASVKKESPHIQKLAAAAKSRTPIAWARIYSVPEYVWFSHAIHHKEAGLECQTCHGAVQDREVLAKEKATNMFSCMKCHAQKSAPNGCDSCHSSQ